MAFAIATDETIDGLKEVIDMMNDRIDQTRLYQKGEKVL